MTGWLWFVLLGDLVGLSFSVRSWLRGRRGTITGVRMAGIGSLITLFVFAAYQWHLVAR